LIKPPIITTLFFL